ncbi:MAG: FecR domain-containing protein [Odoribacteraceae bacterium]|jgi:ferric-dicitrate binding protein FerR (iron transport regulator)|nr:FecR domain-containing protein [Odoribacteraceae bacterium]
MVHFPEKTWERLVGWWRGGGDPPGEEDFPLLKEQFLIRRAMRGTGGHAYDVERAWRSVSGARRRWLLPARVAGCAAVVAAGVWLSVSWPREPSGGGLDIVPGSAKAEVLLASGEVVPLEAHGARDRWQGDGIVLVNDTASGRLRYDATGEEGDSAPRYHTLQVPQGGEYQLELPDGTVIWVNSRSSVRFPERFPAGAREVFLQGEAYFVVARDDAAPFRVHAGEQVVTVTGTTFNVSAYEDDDIWRATLVEGSVRVSNGGNEVTLSPSTQYVLDRRSGEYVVEEVDSYLYTSWIHGRFHFKAFAFEELVKKLERWYDFRMIYADDSVKRRRFTGFVNKHEPIERMLTLLEMTTNIQFEGNDKTITVAVKPSDR